MHNKPGRPNFYSNLYIFLACVILLLGSLFFSWPIEALDTDLWYHLSGGRYFFTEGAIPHNSFFSFLTPAREYVDYYWLFQVIVYKIYSSSGYLGLIVLRAVIFLLTVSFVFLLMFENQKDERNYFFLAVVFLLLIFILIPRAQAIRPHIFSYFFIILFLYILELHPKKLFLLPIFSILWCNIHGVEYYVILLIILSYLSEYAIDYFRSNERISKEHLRYILPAMMAMAVVYMTPHGYKLLSVPLKSIHVASEFIQELKVVPFQDIIFSFQVVSASISWQTAANIFIILVFSCMISLLWKRRIRVSHFFLIIGGCILLLKASRFIYEFSVLSIPMIRSNPIIMPVIDNQKKVQKGWLFFFILLLILPAIAIRSYFMTTPRYPLSIGRLPEGVVTFLKRIPAEGRILNHPNFGGYLQWELYPKYKIAMDLQMPFLFNDEDLYSTVISYKNEDAFSKTIQRYNPTFIILYHDQMKQIILKHPEYKPVFLDHVATLFMNKDHYPAITKKYEIKNFNPLEMVGYKISSLTTIDRKRGFVEDLTRILYIYPECFPANELMALFNLGEGKGEEALQHADAIVKNFPETPTGYRLKGTALFMMKHYEDAKENFFKALERTGRQDEKEELYKKIGYAYVAMHDYSKAYRYLKKGVHVFSEKTTYKEIWDLSTSALLTGKFDEAYMLTLFVSWIVPENDRKYKNHVEKRLNIFKDIEQTSEHSSASNR